jgi:hypothetical protein
MQGVGNWNNEWTSCSNLVYYARSFCKSRLRINYTLLQSYICLLEFGENPFSWRSLTLVWAWLIYVHQHKTNTDKWGPYNSTVSCIIANCRWITARKSNFFLWYRDLRTSSSTHGGTVHGSSDLYRFFY